MQVNNRHSCEAPGVQVARLSTVQPLSVLCGMQHFLLDLVSLLTCYEKEVEGIYK